MRPSAVAARLPHDAAVVVDDNGQDDDQSRPHLRALVAEAVDYGMHVVFDLNDDKPTLKPVHNSKGRPADLDTS